MNVELTVVGKRLLSSDGRKKKVIVVADNKDYFIKFNGVDESIAVFAKFRKDGKYQDILISSDRIVQIPLWVLSEGFFEVGLYNDSTATTAFEFEVVTSILEEEGIETETPEPGVVEQLISLVNGLEQRVPSEAGNGVKSASVNADGALILILANGTEINCGKQGLTEQQVKALIDEAISHIAKFDGDYTVTPKVTAQTLSTKSKLMTDDLTVREIPTFEVGNDFGTTFYIGKEL